MNNIIKSLFKHKCRFNKPIVSMYWGFDSRKIIYECKCGKRISQTITTPFDEPFPIETNDFIFARDYDAIVAGKDFKKMGRIIICEE